MRIYNEEIENSKKKSLKNKKIEKRSDFKYYPPHLLELYEEKWEKIYKPPNF